MEQIEPSTQAIDCFWGKNRMNSIQNISITSLITLSLVHVADIGVELSGKNRTHSFEEEAEEDVETVLELRQVKLLLHAPFVPS